MTVDLQGLARVLEASLDPAQNKQGTFIPFNSFALPDELTGEQLSLLYYRKNRSPGSHCLYFKLCHQKHMVALHGWPVRFTSRITSREDGLYVCGQGYLDEPSSLLIGHVG